VTGNGRPKAAAETPAKKSTANSTAPADNTRDAARAALRRRLARVILDLERRGAAAEAHIAKWLMGGIE